MVVSPYNKYHVLEVRRRARSETNLHPQPLPTPRRLRMPVPRADRAVGRRIRRTLRRQRLTNALPRGDGRGEVSWLDHSLPGEGLGRGSPSLDAACINRRNCSHNHIPATPTPQTPPPPAAPAPRNATPRATGSPSSRRHPSPAAHAGRRSAANTSPASYPAVVKQYQVRHHHHQ